MVKLILTHIAVIHITSLVHLRGSITVVLVDECIVEVDLRLTLLVVIIRVVETETISQRHLLDGLDVSLDLAEELLRVVVVVVVLDSPVGVGDTVRCVPSLRCIESCIQISAVIEAEVAGELKHTVDHRSTLVRTHGVGLCLGEVHARRNLQPVCGIIAATISDRITVVGILIVRDDTVVRAIRVAQIIGHLVVVADTVQGHAVAGAHTRLEEVLDVILYCLVLVDQLLVVPYRTVNLGATIELRTPRTVLNEGLGTVPTLSELVLHLRQRADVTPLYASVVGNLEVTLTLLLTALGGDHDHTVGSAATIESGSGSTLQHGHRLDIVRVDA